MKKAVIAAMLALLCIFSPISASAASYVVQGNDTMWTIAVRYGISIDELILANPQVADPNNIWPGLALNIPDNNAGTPGGGAPGGKESLTFLYAGNSASYLRIIDTAYNSLNTLCPDYFDIDANGNLLITPSDKIDLKFIEQMHGRGIRLTPFISNHWDKEKGNIALNNREALSNQVVKAILAYNLDGVNIDIENVNEQYRGAYTDFTRLLRAKLPAGKIVSVSVAANPNGWNTGWHGSYDYKALSDASDYLMIMTYDESYYGGPSGPISSKAFFDNSIKYALNKGVPKEKIVAGMPFFGRFWKTGDAIGGNGITANDVEFLIGHYQSSKSYDTARESANVKVTIKKGDPEPKLWGGRVLDAGVYDIWYDDLQAVKYKLALIRDYGIKGAGSWALGQENTEMWKYYSDSLNGGSAAATSTPVPTSTSTPLPTSSFTPKPTNTFTPAPTNTPTPKLTNTFTPLPTNTFTPVPTNTFTPAPTDTFTPAPTDTFTPMPTVTSVPSPTNGPPMMPTETPVNTQTPPPLLEDSLNEVLNILNAGNTREVYSCTALTRGEFTVLWAMLGNTEPEWGGYGFTDTEEYWGAGYINALFRRGIVYENNKYFYPNMNIRKDDACLYLERMLVLPDTIDFHWDDFKDVPLCSNAYNAVAKLCYFNVASGASEGYFRPESDVTAYDVALMLNQIKRFEYPLNPNKYLERSRQRGFGPINPELDKTHVDPR